MTAYALDLELDGLRGSLTTFFLDGPEPTLVDPGPATTLGTLETKLDSLGARLGDVRHVRLTHVHLDHAGVTGHLTERIPGLAVHVHEDAARHLVDPQRLVASTRRTFGEAHDRLWGEVRPVPAHRIRSWTPGSTGREGVLRTLPTPGHIDHHVSWLDESDGTLFAGDALGIVLFPGAPSHPPTPPPGVDLGAWSSTLDRLGSLRAERAAVAHAGFHDDVPDRVEGMRDALEALERRVVSAVEAGRAEEDAAAWAAEVKQKLKAERSGTEGGSVDGHFEIFRLETDYGGVERYVRKARDRA